MPGPSDIGRAGAINVPGRRPLLLRWQPAVSCLLVTRVKGSALRLRTETLGGRTYCVLPYQDHDQDVSWTAYDAAGHLLGNGSVSRLLS
jgi:hypothetical protein